MGWSSSSSTSSSSAREKVGTGGGEGLPSSDLEVKLRVITVTLAHFRDGLTGADTGAFGDFAAAVVPVGAQPGVIMLDNNQLTVAYETVAAVYDFAGGGCQHGLSLTTADVHTLPG